MNSHTRVLQAVKI